MQSRGLSRTAEIVCQSLVSLMSLTAIQDIPLIAMAKPNFPNLPRTLPGMRIGLVGQEGAGEQSLPQYKYFKRRKGRSCIFIHID